MRGSIKHQLDTLPRLWQNIQIEKGWEDALEAVLRERLNSARLEQLESAHDWVDDSPPGKWALFESREIAGAGRAGKRYCRGQRRAGYRCKRI